MTPKQTEMKTETICFGDCLEHLQQWIRWNDNIFEGQPSLADLIYLDPPWNSKANYNILFGSDQAAEDETQSAQETAFTDMWQWNDEAKRRVQLITGEIYHDDYADHPAFKSILSLKTLLGKSGMLAYCSYMAERLALLRMMLKETGSIYLHCDSHASHYLKIIMDNIFGAENFRNEIVWCYTGPGSPKMRQFNRKIDTIFWYSKGEKWTFNRDKMRIPYKDGKPHTGGFTHKSGAKAGSKMTSEVAEEYESKGKVLENWWTDIAIASRSKKEYQGYATQKPLALLKRIIKASTNEGDVVLDPFCGCGTAVVVASMLKRKFVGIDISLFSVETVTSNRLNKEAGIAEEDIKILGIPADLASAKRLAKDDPFAFERFAVEACHPGMVANKVQRGDKGSDGTGMLLHPVKENGKKKRKILAQVKAGKPTLSQVRDFATVIRDTEGAVAGVFITVEKIGKEGDGTDGMREVAYQQGTFQHEHSVEEFPRLQFWHIGQWFYKTPHLRLPNLPELADPLSGKEMTALKQTGFLTKQYGK